MDALSSALCQSVPVIDLFAGPGGLGEGFASYCARGCPSSAFRIVRSVEMDPHAHATLELRAFRRAFEPWHVPPEYYDYLRGAIDRDTLYRAYRREAEEAVSQALLAELGRDDAAIFASLNDALAVHGNDDLVLIGGPPCQAYSVIGRARRAQEPREEFEADPKHRLYEHYLAVIARYRPAVFVMENVKGLLSATLSNNRVFDRILADLRQPGRATNHGVASDLRYRIWSIVTDARADAALPADYVIRCERYGVPQTRHRVILLGVRSDISARPKTLVPDPGACVRDAIDSLPALRSDISTPGRTPTDWGSCIRGAPVDSWDVSQTVHEALAAAKGGLREAAPRLWQRNRTGPRERLAAWYRSAREPVVCNHEARTHMPEDLHRYLFAACYAQVYGTSPKLCDFPPDLLPEHQSAHVDKPGFDDRFRVQVWDRPSSTITSHIAKDGHYYIHPDPTQCRSLTVREAARLQTFPDDYFFEGPRTEQYRQVGNAVPPFLAHQIADIVYDLLQRRHES